MTQLQKMEFSTYSISVAGKKPAARHQNQDRVLCRKLEVNGCQAALLVVADGVGGCPFGGSVARLVVEQHLANDVIAFSDGCDPADTLKSYLGQIYRDFHAEFAASGPEGFLDSAATLSLGLLHHGSAECLWAGDSPIYLSRKHPKGFITEMISRPDHNSCGHITNCFGAGSPFDLRHRHLDLACGDILTLTSDGAAVDEDTLSRVYRAKAFTKAALDEMIRLSARGRFWDDLSIVAGHANPSPDIQ